LILLFAGYMLIKMLFPACADLLSIQH
jgi:hypothetical protein